MIINIVETLDEDKLNTNIDNFIFTYCRTPYICANKQTIDILISSTNINYLLCENSNRAGFAGWYNDCKIIYDDSKAFGEVELK